MRWIVVSIVIVIVSFVLSLVVLNSLPPVVASHWDAKGAVNGTLPRFWGAFLMPLVGFVLFLMLTFIPRIDPKKKNIASFQKEYEAFVALFLLFLLYVHVLSLGWNLGVIENMIVLIVPGFAVLFFAIGVLVGHAKQNWFIGIRTPWTLEDEEVWDRTHRVGGKLFKAWGVVCLAGVFFPAIALWFVVLGAFLIAVVSFGYSYVLFQKRKKKKK